MLVVFVGVGSNNGYHGFALRYNFTNNRVGFSAISYLHGAKLGQRNYLLTYIRFMYEYFVPAVK